LPNLCIPITNPKVVFIPSRFSVKISISESEQPHQYDFNEFQFDYKGVPGQALL